MFTGLIEEIGKIKNLKYIGSLLKVDIESSKCIENLKIGDSISVNGVCLTVTDLGKTSFSSEVSRETVERTTFKIIKKGDYVNLERPLTINEMLGGHLVQGHIDCVVKISNIKNIGESTEFMINIPNDFIEYIVEKGSVALDGISLTVARLIGNNIIISIIPETLKRTTLQYKKKGNYLNLEVDIIAKYVKNFVTKIDSNSLNLGKLKSMGY
ncbi:MAG: riboflavin synthase [Candidatus Marinimicrobia bacterium]|nr:riboflavin synthase [Candidatus Neomarinimicrobiota bacterium]